MKPAGYKTLLTALLLCASVCLPAYLHADEPTEPPPAEEPTECQVPTNLEDLKQATQQALDEANARAKTIEDANKALETAISLHNQVLTSLRAEQDQHLKDHGTISVHLAAQIEQVALALFNDENSLGQGKYELEKVQKEIKELEDLLNELNSPCPFGPPAPEDEGEEDPGENP